MPLLTTRDSYGDFIRWGVARRLFMRVLVVVLLLRFRM